MMALAGLVVLLAQAPAGSVEVPAEVTVVATPLRPATTKRPVVTADDFARIASPSVLDALEQRVAGASLSDVQGSPFSQGFDFRGFQASPVVGAAQGLAVYLSGMRLNEAFGDSVNWDLIPEAAIARADVETSAPAFGLNAIGGAVALTAKSGETWQGREATLRAGSFGRREGALQLGGLSDGFSYYLAADGAREDGWRQRSPASLARTYGDIGWRRGALDLHLVAGAATSSLGVVGPTPVDLLALDRTAVFTSPQNSRNTDGFVGVNARYHGASGWDISAEAHARRFVQHHVDGNNGDFEGCSRTRTNPLYNTLCMQDDAFPSAIRPAAAAFQVLNQNGAPIPCPPLVSGQTKPCNGIPYGATDRSRTTGDTVGLSGELTRRDPLFGRRNLLVLGAAVDYSRFDYASSSELGYIAPDLVVGPNAAIPGLGSIIHTAGLIGYAPVSLSGRRTDAGIYAVDTLTLTERLALTASARLNSIRISTQDDGGGSPELNGSHRFSRVNPALTLSYRLEGGLRLYGTYSEANRAPTPLELGCSDPLKPCLLENALVADPPLKQVTARTIEAGLKGERKIGTGRLNYSLVAFDTELRDDIIPLASAIQGRGYYTNVPGTRRRGLDASLGYERGPISLFAGFAHVDASYRFSGRLASPNSPAADAGGDILIRQGDRIGGIPADRWKLGADYKLIPALDIGMTVVGQGPHRLVGDENGSDARLAGFTRIDLRAEWRISRQISLEARALNVGDAHYATYGAYFDPGGVSDVGSRLPSSAGPRTVTPAAPRAFRLERVEISLHSLSF